MLLNNTYIVFLALWKALTFSSSVRELFSLGSILILQMQCSAYLIMKHQNKHYWKLNTETCNKRISKAAF